MKTFKITNKLFLSLFAVALISCSDDDTPAPVNEEEVITTVRTTLVGGGQTITLLSRDLDGDGPNAPVVTVSGNLMAGTTYTGSVAFLNETVNPAGDITTEVEEEGVDHQIFYQAPTSIGTFTYTDTDANGKPIGIDFTLVTAAASSGNLIVTLRHLPNKAAVGVATGDITNAGGATDAQVTYPIVVN
ncbi:type 1 periplasmic binding fold superfamily protein [Flavobacterium sp.]|uniref:type 1 periplasmic binding fold superfamily protein n=1 Tax=Flavobacterium sp. TaxID=239 RepID=UPI00260559ED|nr:type 1 periplasmic binding fold superfamily protein [Flavobacterium sp.]